MVIGTGSVLAYTSSILTVIAGLAITRLFGLELRAEFASYFAVLNVCISVQNFHTLESAARGTRVKSLTLRTTCIACGCVVIASAYSGFVNDLQPSVLLIGAAITWAITSNSVSAYLGALKVAGDVTEIGKIRVAFALFVLLLLAISATAVNSTEAILACYSAANILTVLYANSKSKYKETASAEGTKFPNIQMLLCGVVIGIYGSLEQIIGPTLVTFEQLGVYLLVKGFLTLAAPFAAVVSMKAYSDAALARRPFPIPLRHLVGICASVLTGTTLYQSFKEEINRFFGISIEYHGLDLTLLAICCALTMCAQVAEEALKGRKKLMQVTLINCAAITCGLAAAQIVDGARSLLVLVLISSLVKFAAMTFVLTRKVG